MKVFILEDMESRIIWFKENLKDCELIFSDNYSDAIKILETEKDIDKLFLDNDINFMIHKDAPDIEWNGYQVAKWIKDHDLTYNEIVIHSCNGPAADNIYHELKNSAKTVTLIPYYELKNFL